MENSTTARLIVVHFLIRQVTFSVIFSIVLDQLFLCPQWNGMANFARVTKCDALFANKNKIMEMGRIIKKRI